jgi:glycosyltransferase involved in cell wall biosynthesis
MTSVLYLSYDGMCDQIGQSQVLPYLIGCAGAGHRVTLISFEKPARMAAFGEDVRRKCADAAINWLPQRFHSFPPLLSKAADMLAMRGAADRAVRGSHFDLVHARSYPAGLAALRLKQRHGVPLLFDMRGFWPDQRREGGRWSNRGLLGRSLYRYWKGIEARLLAEADHIVVLTTAARDAIATMPDYRGAPISVIPCAADFALFRIASEEERADARARIGIPHDAPVLAYLGSLGTVYRLDAMLRLFAETRERVGGLKFLFIGKGSIDQLLSEAARLGIALHPDEIRSVSAARTEVPQWLNAADIGLCFCTPTFSSAGVSATKVGEYLACGLPIIGNVQIGDFARIVSSVGIGLTVADLSDASIEVAAAAIPSLLGADRLRVRDRARRFLDLGTAVDGYRRIYEDLRAPVAVEP